MKDFEKAKEISQDCYMPDTGFNREDLYNSAIEMAQWKDEQHRVVYVVTRCEEHSDYVEEVFFDIEKAEQYCAKYNSDEDNYRRHITKINVTL